MHGTTFRHSEPPQQRSDVTERIEQFCGDCHELPNPESFERHVWREEVIKGFEFYARSGRQDLVAPRIDQVMKYFEERSSEHMIFPDWADVDQTWTNRFQTELLDWSSKNVPIGTSSLNWIQFKDSKTNRLFACDARDGSLRMLKLRPEKSTQNLFLYLQNPARMVLSDVDCDGFEDILVADLGSFMPFDHSLGRVLAMRRNPKTKGYLPTVVAQGLGRIADVTSGHFSGGQKPDLIVAEFGHRETGGILYLENKSEGAAIQFQARRIDSRPGTVRVIVHDWDRDGIDDFAALISQESECVELFLSRNGKFENRRIWSAGDLAFGCVAMELVDLDQDSDMDILICNGDTFDNNKANKSHGLQWLENRGSMQFLCHRLLDLSGAYGSKAGDLDGDGDLDIVLIANLPEKVEPAQLLTVRSPSIVVLEQVSKMTFQPRVLNRSFPSHSTIELADFNDDGKLDFAVGSIAFGPRSGPQDPSVTIWWQK